MTVNNEYWDTEEKSALKILWQHRELIVSLVLKDIRSRYKQSVLGIAWALIQPLAVLMINIIVFSLMFKAPTNGIPYPIFSYVAILPWSFFAAGITSGTECLTSNFNLITKIYFPREVFPIAAVLGKSLDLALGIIVLIFMFIFYKVSLSWYILLVIPVFIIELAFLLGITFLLSSFNLFYRDIRHAIPLITQIWSFLCPVAYSAVLVPNAYKNLYYLNPMASIINSIRNVLVESKAPDWTYLGLAAIVSFIFLIVGYYVFKKLEPAFAEMI